MTAGVERGYDDARRIERAVEDDRTEVVTFDLDDSAVADRLRRHPGLSDADVAVLARADARDGAAVMDESAAEVENIETRGAAYPVLSAVERGAMAPERGRETIDVMVDVGWYVAPDLYAKIVRKLDSFE